MKYLILFLVLFFGGCVEEVIQPSETTGSYPTKIIVEVSNSDYAKIEYQGKVLYILFDTERDTLQVPNDSILIKYKLPTKSMRTMKILPEEMRKYYL